jgi:hypothetical protein
MHGSDVRTARPETLPFQTGDRTFSAGQTLRVSRMHDTALVLSGQMARVPESAFCFCLAVLVMLWVL